MRHPTRLSILTAVLAAAGLAEATNGDNLIAIGPNARGMGGLSIAAPQDAISAVFGNPATMCFGRFCPSTQVDVAATIFLPHVDASVTNAFGMNQTIAAEAEEKVYPIPAIGISLPLAEGSEQWRFGLAAYGVTGLGVDYKDTVLDQPDIFGPGAPLIAGEFTALQIMKVAPAISYQLAPDFSVGAAFHLDYATLDMGAGSRSGFGYGVQLGLLWRPQPNLSIGLSYTSAQKVNHEDVIAQQTPTGIARFDLELEAPQQFGVGLAFEAMDHRLLTGVDVKWVNWSDAAGYREFDWEDQTVFAFGVQYAVVPKKFFVRAGFNYGANPVKEHHDWNGAFTPQGPAEWVPVQDTAFPRYYYETFRIIGFPAIVEQHLTVGFTYELSDAMALSFAYMRALENDISETGIGPAGTPVTITSTLSEDSFEFSGAWRF